MIHTLQFRILDRVSLTVSENVMYKYNVMEGLYFNPSFIFHNLNNRSMFNAFAYLEVNWAVAKGLEVYGQYAMDQARAPHEGDSQSGASGFVAGVQCTCILGNGYLASHAEFAYTTPLLYRRDIVDFVRADRYWSHSATDGSFGGGHVTFFDFIGFPYGGDCMMIELKSTYISLDSWSASAYIRAMDHGVMDICMSHNTDGYNQGDANYHGSTPSGDVTVRSLMCGLGFRADLERMLRWPGISFSGNLDWVNRWDYTKAVGSYSGHEADLQLTFGMTISV